MSEHLRCVHTTPLTCLSSSATSPRTYSCFFGQDFTPEERSERNLRFEWGAVVRNIADVQDLDLEFDIEQFRHIIEREFSVSHGLFHVHAPQALLDHSLQDSSVIIFDFVNYVFLAKKVLTRIDPRQTRRRLRTFY